MLPDTDPDSGNFIFGRFLEFEILQTRKEGLMKPEVASILSITKEKKVPIARVYFKVFSQDTFQKTRWNKEIRYRVRNTY